MLCDADGTNRVAQYDKDDVEAAGLVKFDFLGLRNLTVIEDAIQNINKTAIAMTLLNISHVLLTTLKLILSLLMQIQPRYSSLNPSV